MREIYARLVGPRNDDVGPIAYCGKPDADGRQTCTGQFGAFRDIEGRGWAFVMFLTMKQVSPGTWHPTSGALKRKGNKSLIRRRWVEGIDLGPRGNHVIGDVALPVRATCPRCEVLQVIPAELAEECDQFYHTPT